MYLWVQVSFVLGGRGLKRFGTSCLRAYLHVVEEAVVVVLYLA